MSASVTWGLPPGRLAASKATYWILRVSGMASGVARRVLLEEGLELRVAGIDGLLDVVGGDDGVVELHLGALRAVGLAHGVVGDGDPPVTRACSRLQLHVLLTCFSKSVRLVLKADHLLTKLM